MISIGREKVVSSVVLLFPVAAMLVNARLSRFAGVVAISAVPLKASPFNTRSNVELPVCDGDAGMHPHPPASKAIRLFAPYSNESQQRPIVVLV
jgi:hypothetical protein